MPATNRPTCFQDKPLHQFEYTSKFVESVGFEPLCDSADVKCQPLHYRPQALHSSSIVGLVRPYGQVKNQSSHHGGTTLATHMYIFKCCLRPTSGCECVWNRIRTYGAAKPHGKLTACCLKPLGHPNILAGMVGLAPTVLGLTGRCCILLKLHPNVVDAIGFEPMFFYCHSSQSPEDSLHASI